MNINVVQGAELAQRVYDEGSITLKPLPGAVAAVVAILVADSTPFTLTKLEQSGDYYIVRGS